MKKIVFMASWLILISLSFSFYPKEKSYSPTMNNQSRKAKNVLGEELQSCCFEPKTGWYRDGFCHTDISDRGQHVVCAEMTDDFLNFSAKCGNNLKTPMPAYGFPGLKAGDKWCLCVSRWKEAMEAGLAPPVILESTHQKALEVVTLEELEKHELE